MKIRANGCLSWINHESKTEKWGAIKAFEHYHLFKESNFKLLLNR
jgi:hypothetical protein